MTYEYEYTVVFGNGDRSGSHTLYEACKALIEIATAGNLTDCTHVRRDGRPVAFFSEWREDRGVRAMFGANEIERRVLAEDWIR